MANCKYTVWFEPVLLNDDLSQNLSGIASTSIELYMLFIFLQIYALTESLTNFIIPYHNAASRKESKYYGYELTCYVK